MTTKPRAKRYEPYYRYHADRKVWEVRCTPGPGEKTRNAFGKTKKIVIEKGKRLKDGTYPRRTKPKPTPPPDPGVPTLAAYAHDWLALRLAQGFSEDTAAKTYRPALDRVLPFIGHLPLVDLTPTAVNDAWVQMAAHPYSPGTIRLSRRVLKLCLEAAVEADCIARNPVRGRPPRPPLPSSKDITAPRAQAILRAVRGRSACGPVTLGLLLGLRLGEVLGLRWQDVDRMAGVLHIRGQAREDGSYKGRTKSGHTRDLPLLPPVLAVLDAEAEAQAQTGASVYVFAGRRRGTRSRTGVRVSMELALQAAGLPRCTFHDLRHMTATLLQRLGVDEKVRQAIVGHASLQVHGLYLHVSAEEKEKALRRLTDLLG